MASSREDKSTKSILDRLKKAGSKPIKYATGLGKMVFQYGGLEYINSALPEIQSFYSTNEDFLRSTVAFLKNPSEIIHKNIDIAMKTDAFKNASEIIDNMIDDLRTGNFYDKDRMRGSGFGDEWGDLDDDSFGGFDFEGFDEDGNYDDDFKSDNSKDDANKDVKIAKVQEENEDDRARATIGAIGTAAGAIVQNDNKNDRRNIGIRVKQHSQTISGLQNLTALTASIHTMIGNSAKISTELTREIGTQVTQRLDTITTLLIEIKAQGEVKPSSETEYREAKNDPFESGAFNFKSYMRKVASNAKDALNLDMLLGSLSMATSETMMDALKSDPWAVLLGGPLFRKLLPDSFVKESETFSRNVGSFFPALLQKLYTQGEDDNLSPVKQMIGKIFGFKNRSSTTVDTTMENLSGKAEFTNKVAKAITDVIPMQLSKIISLMSGEREKIFDYRKGEFVDYTKIVSSRSRSLNDLAGRSDTYSLIQELVNSSVIFKDSDEKKSINDFLYNSIQKYMQANKQFSPTEDFERVKNFLGESDDKKVALFLGALGALPRDRLMYMARDTYDARAQRDRANFNINSAMRESGEIMAFSGLTDEDITNRIYRESGRNSSSITDERITEIENGVRNSRFRRYGVKSPFELIRDIRNILAGGIVTFSYDIGRIKNSTDIDSINNPTEEIVDREDNSEFAELARARLRAIRNSEQVSDIHDSQDERRVLMRRAIDERRSREEENSREREYRIENGSQFTLAGVSSVEGFRDAFATANVRHMTRVEAENDPLYQEVRSRMQGRLNTISDARDEILNKSGISKLIDGIRGVIQEPFKLVEKGMKAMDTAMFRIIYGDGSSIEDDDSDASLISRITNVLQSNLNKLNEWFNNAVLGENGLFAKAGNKLRDFFTPIGKSIHNKLIGVKNDTDNKYRGGILSGLINGLRGETGNISENIKTKFHNAIDGLLYGRKDKNGVPIKGSRGVIGGLQDGFDKFKTWLFGEDEVTDSKIKFERVKDEVKKSFPGAIIGAGLGAAGTAGVGMLTGLWLPGGPILGGIIGSAVGFVSSSDRLKDYIFGKQDVDGSREGGLISKDVQEWFKKHVPVSGGGAAAGALLGKIGILPLGIGPVLGGVIGGLSGLVLSSDRLRKALFGDGEDDDSGLFSKNARKVFLKSVPLGLLGGVSGLAAWNLISSGLGFIPGLALLPGGPIFAALGAIGVGLNTDNIMKFLFGDEEEITKTNPDGSTTTTKQRSGGVFGKAFDAVKDKAFDPFVSKMDDIGKKVIKWFDEDIANPFESAMEPMKKAMAETAENIKESFKGFGESIVNSINSTMEESLGQPLKEYMEEHVFNKLRDATKKVFGAIGTAIGTVLSSPFKTINYMFNNGEITKTGEENTPLPGNSGESGSSIKDSIIDMMHQNSDVFKMGSDSKLSQFTEISPDTENASYTESEESRNKKIVRQVNDDESIRKRLRERAQEGLVRENQSRRTNSRIAQAVSSVVPDNNTVYNEHANIIRHDESSVYEGENTKPNVGNSNVSQEGSEWIFEQSQRHTNSNARTVQEMIQDIQSQNVPVTEQPSNNPDSIQSRVEELQNNQTQEATIQPEEPSEQSTVERLSHTINTNSPDESSDAQVSFNDIGVQFFAKKRAKSPSISDDSSVHGRIDKAKRGEYSRRRAGSLGIGLQYFGGKSNIQDETRGPISNEMAAQVSQPLSNLDALISPVEEIRDILRDNIKNDVSKIFKEVDGQLGSVGWNLEKIRKILEQNLDFEDDGEEGGRRRAKRRGIFGKFDRFFGSISDKIHGAIDSITAPFKKVGGAIKSFGKWLTNLPKAIFEAGTQMFAGLGKLAGGFFEGLGDAASGFLYGINAFTEATIPLLGTALKSLSDFGLGLANFTGKILGGIAKGTASFVKEIFAGLGKLGESAAYLGKTLFDIGKSLFDGFVGVLKGGFSLITGRGKSNKKEKESKIQSKILNLLTEMKDGMFGDRLVTRVALADGYFDKVELINGKAAKEPGWAIPVYIAGMNNAIRIPTKDMTNVPDGETEPKNSIQEALDERREEAVKDKNYARVYSNVYKSLNARVDNEKNVKKFYDDAMSSATSRTEIEAVRDIQQLNSGSSDSVVPYGEGGKEKSSGGSILDNIIKYLPILVPAALLIFNFLKDKINLGSILGGLGNFVFGSEDENGTKQGGVLGGISSLLKGSDNNGDGEGDGSTLNTLVTGGNNRFTRGIHNRMENMAKSGARVMFGNIPISQIAKLSTNDTARRAYSSAIKAKERKLGGNFFTRLFADRTAKSELKNMKRAYKSTGYINAMRKGAKRTYKMAKDFVTGNSAINSIKNKAVTKSKSVISTIKDKFTSNAAKAGVNVAEDIAQDTGKSLVSTAVSTTVKSTESGMAKTILDAMRKVFDKLMQNKTIIKTFGKFAKFLGHIRDKVLNYISKSLMGEIIEKAGKAAVSASLKTIAGLSTAGVLTVAFAVADFISGMGRAHQYFSVRAQDVTLGMRLTSGIVDSIISVLTIIPVVGTVASMVLAMVSDVVVRLVYGIISDDDTKQELEKKQESLQKAVDEYNSENGTNLSTEEYKKQVEGGSNFLKEILYTGKNIGEAILNSAPDFLKTIGDGIKEFSEGVLQGVTDTLSWIKDKATGFVSSVGNGIQTAKDGVVSGAKWIWDGTKWVVGNVVDGVKSFFGFDSNTSTTDTSTTNTSATSATTNEAEVGKGRGLISRAKAFDQTNPEYQKDKSQHMAEVGCGPTSAAIVASAYGKDVNPLDASKTSVAMGMRASDGGTNPDFFNKYGSMIGVDMKEGTPNKEHITNSLQSHKPVIMMGKGGAYGNNMHYMVAESSDANGNAKVIDPIGGQRKNVKMDDMLKNTSKTIYSGYGTGNYTFSPKTKSNDRFIAMTGEYGKGTLSGESGADAIVRVAQGEIGYMEKATNSQLDSKTSNPGDANYTKYGAWYGMNGQPWCAMFVSWCANQAGVLGIVPKYASCSDGASKFQAKNQWKPKGYRPQKGDIIFFTHSHTGIVSGSDEKYVYTIEGNTSGTAGDRDGGEVASHKYDLNYAKIKGYGTPNYGGQRTYGTAGEATALSGSDTGTASTSTSSGSSGFLGKISSALDTIMEPVSNTVNAIGGLLSNIFMPLEGDASQSSDGSGDSITYASSGSGPLTGGSDTFNKYDLSPDQITDIATMITGETGGKDIVAARQEASQLANLTEKSYGSSATPAQLIKRLHSGWYAKTSWNHGVQDAAKQAVDEVLVQGKRVLPRYVTEHDMFPEDIKNAKSRDAYKAGDDVSNIYGSDYQFYDFFGSDKKGDISGYFKSDYDKMTKANPNDKLWGAGRGISSDDEFNLKTLESFNGDNTSFGKGVSNLSADFSVDSDDYGKGAVSSYVDELTQIYKEKSDEMRQQYQVQTDISDAVNNLTDVISNNSNTSSNDALAATMLQMLNVLQVIANNTAKPQVIVNPVPEAGNGNISSSPRITPSRNVVRDSYSNIEKESRDIGAYSINKLTLPD